MNKKPNITAALLKNIAIALMFINHAGDIVFEKVLNYRGFFYDLQWYISRPAFVIFAFFIAEGMYKTHDRKKYCIRLLITGLISEIPFDLMWSNTLFDFSSQNVLFTLFFGALAIMLIDKYKGFKLMQWAIFVSVAILTYFMNTDYKGFGIALILCFYYLRDDKLKMFIVAGCILYFGYMLDYIDVFLMYRYYFNIINEYALMELHGALAFPLLYFYNGDKGKMFNKWFYYLFYPAHHFVIYLLCKFVFRVY